MSDEAVWERSQVVARSRLILRSFHRVVGRALLPEGGDDGAMSRALFHAPFAVLAHGVEADPILFYGNAAALGLWEMDFDGFTKMPSRLTAEPVLREERQRLLERAGRKGYIDDYAGVRVSSRGARFRIESVILWNLLDEAGTVHGQAAFIPTHGPA